MSERAPYSRVYWTVRNDPRLAGIYADDHHWATWNRLLIAADMAWPASADVPASARPSSLRVLEAAGVIELLPGGLFTFHGLDGERGRRRRAAVESATHRTPTERPPFGDRTETERPLRPRPKPSLAEPRQAEPSNVRADDDFGDDALDTYWQVMGSYPTGRSKTWIVELVNEFDEELVSRAIAAESKGERQGLLGRARDRLRSEAEATAKARALASQARLDAEAAAKRITPEQAAEMRRRTQEELAKMLTPAKAAS